MLVFCCAENLHTNALMKLSCGEKKYTELFSLSLKGIQELFKINFSPMIREESLKKISSKAHGTFS